MDIHDLNPTWDSGLLQPSTKIKTKEGKKLVETFEILFIMCIEILIK